MKELTSEQDAQLAVPAALAAGISAERLGDRAFSHLVQTDVQGLLGQASAGDARTVTEDADRPARTGPALSSLDRDRRQALGPHRLSAPTRQDPTGQGPAVAALDAEEYFAVQPPGFVWDARLAPGPIAGGTRPRPVRPRPGSMLIKAASLITVADASGEAMDQGSMLRYLNEMMWFPTAFLGDNISFEAIGDTSARVT